MKSRRIIIGLIMTNIILIGMLCNVICKNKNIIKEKQIIKEMNENTQITDLNNQINSLNTEHTEYMNYIQSCKIKIATALTNEGVTTSDQATLETMAGNISKVLQTRTKDATATADDILEGKTAWVDGNLISGKLHNVNSKSEVSYISSSTTNTYDKLYATLGTIIQDENLMTYDSSTFTANKNIEVTLWYLASTNNNNQNYNFYVYKNYTLEFSAKTAGGYRLSNTISMNKGDTLQLYCQQSYPVDYHGIQAYLIINEV